MIRSLILPLVSGAIFGAGLTIGGMTDPARVRGFLDLFGSWDPTLAFVMGGAVLVMALAWAIQRRMQRPAFEESFSLPDARDITPRLVGGSALFGIGWGIAGLCPGPGFAALVIAPVPAAIFVAAMLVGMGFARLAETRGRT
ncbi:MAG: YeeE/YedE family protein [Porphyrobacter sp.]|nr:YeeE/YedE family protein [Porphyrobacter sp.]